VLTMELEFHDDGARAAFGQSLMMSVLFIAMLYQRRSLRGQSVAIVGCPVSWHCTGVISLLPVLPLSVSGVAVPVCCYSDLRCDMHRVSYLRATATLCTDKGIY